MSDDNDDPVMALLATQRAVLVAVENLAGQVEAMQGKVDVMSGVLAQLVADSATEAASASKGGADRAMTIGDRFRTATPDQAERDPKLRQAQAHLVAIDKAALQKFADKPDMLALVREKGREQIAVMLDRGEPLPPAPKRNADRGRER